MDQLTVAVHDQRIALWISRIQECRASGLTVDTWCKQNGLTSKNYYYWMRKIKREAFDALPDDMKTRPVFPSCPELPVFAEITSPREKSMDSAAASLRIGDTILKIHNGADYQMIENLLRAVRTVC